MNYVNSLDNINISY